MTTSISLEPVAWVRGGRAEAVDDSWGSVEARIVLADRFAPDALAGLNGFSHLEIVFHFDRVAPDAVVTDARHPRGRTDWPRVGIFAQRGKARPNRIGVSICELVSVAANTLTVRGLDAIDGTPVLDIKPVLKGFLPRGEVREPDWANEIMAAYW